MLNNQKPAITPGQRAELWAEQQVTLLSEGVQDWSVPEYGSTEWFNLAPSDPRRAASLIVAAELWRRYIGGTDLLAWFEEATAKRTPLYQRPTTAELAERRKAKPAKPVQATPGWPPIAIPGRPGWTRRLVNGRQADQPTQRKETAA